jgi:hypothetical protein
MLEKLGKEKPTISAPKFAFNGIVILSKYSKIFFWSKISEISNEETILIRIK